MNRNVSIIGGVSKVNTGYLCQQGVTLIIKKTLYIINENKKKTVFKMLFFSISFYNIMCIYCRRQSVVVCICLLYICVNNNEKTSGRPFILKSHKWR